MPSSLDAIAYFQQNKVLFAPAKAANAGGVAVSALEMSQNSERLQWTFEEVDGRLKDIMKNISKVLARTLRSMQLQTTSSPVRTSRPSCASPMSCWPRDSSNRRSCPAMTNI